MTKAWFNCVAYNWEVRKMECENCGQSLDRGVLTLPWEDGNNPYAYVTCPYCRHENTVYGYGEDDD